MTQKNKSERFFEKYLNTNGFKGKWAYEPSIVGKTKKPDYQLDYDGTICFFEVKELTKKDNEPTEQTAWIDPYTSLRTEINDTRKQFKEFKEYSCSLVIFNINDRQARLRPIDVFGAMLGNLGFEILLDTSKGETVKGTKKNAFLNGGKMVNNKSKQPQNTTINAIIVLRKSLNNIELERAMKEEEKKHVKTFNIVEALEKRIKLHGHFKIRQVISTVIVENPFARIPLPNNIFNGPFDERWRYKNNRCQRIFAGDTLKELEILKKNKKAVCQFDT
jgi:hypothetical protein